MKLYLKECKKIAVSLVYYLFIALLLISWYKDFYGATNEEINEANGITASDYSFDRPLLKEPTEDDEFFGNKTVEDPEKIMTGAAETLLREYGKNSYATYPLGYYKVVSLSEKQQERVLQILCEITGLTEEQLNNLPEGYFPQTNGTIIHVNATETSGNGEIRISGDAADKSTQETDKTKTFISQVTYEHFKELMTEMESTIGENGSNYSTDMLIANFGITEMNYDEATAEYRQTIDDDKVTNGFARLYCDYVGQVLGLYPIFLVVVIWLKDRRHRMDELIFSKKGSSMKLVLARYSAAITMILIPVILLSLESLIPLIGFGSKMGIALDCFAFVKYILWWLLPTAMIATALGTFITLLTDTPIAILIQFMWWLVDRGVTGLSGDTSLFTLMVRHNTLKGYEIIQQHFEAICLNRLCMTGMSIALVIFSVWILDQKRKGKINAANIYAKWFEFAKGKLSAMHKA